MKFYSNRKERGNHLKGMDEKIQFENYKDYFFSLHLNPCTIRTHAYGTLIGLILVPFIFWYKSIGLFLLYLFCVWGAGFFSHKVFDDFYPIKELKNGRANLLYAMEMNYKYFFGTFDKERQMLLEKYPELKAYYGVNEIENSMPFPLKEVP